eukprot:3622277-Pleurochrysis_carterae.AAC.1
MRFGDSRLSAIQCRFDVGTACQFHAPAHPVARSRVAAERASSSVWRALPFLRTLNPAPSLLTGPAGFCRLCDFCVSAPSRPVGAPSRQHFTLRRRGCFLESR